MEKYNRLYSKDNNLFGSKPLEIIKIAEDFFGEDEKIFDIGCGNGRNLLYLLSKGYFVSGLDSSNKAIEIIKSKIDFIISREIKIYNSDIYNFDFSGEYSYLITYILHFLGKEQKKFLLNLKNKTQKSKNHIIESFLNVGHLTGTENFLKEKELLYLYSDWEILYYDEIFKPTFESQRELKQKVARIIARK